MVNFKSDVVGGMAKIRGSTGVISLKKLDFIISFNLVNTSDTIVTLKLEYLGFFNNFRLMISECIKVFKLNSQSHPLGLVSQMDSKMAFWVASSVFMRKLTEGVSLPIPRLKFF